MHFGKVFHIFSLLFKFLQDLKCLLKPLSISLLLMESLTIWAWQRLKVRLKRRMTDLMKELITAAVLEQPISLPQNSEYWQGHFFYIICYKFYCSILINLFF